MNRTRLQALSVVGGSGAFLALAALSSTFLDVKFIYMCLLAASLLGVTFLLGMLLSLPGVKHAFEAAAKWIKRNSRKICIGIVGLLLLVATGLFLSEDGHRFVASYRTEFFWLVFFPGMFLLPYFYAVLASRLRSKKQDSS